MMKKLLYMMLAFPAAFLFLGVVSCDRDNEQFVGETFLENAQADEQDTAPPPTSQQIPSPTTSPEQTPAFTPAPLEPIPVFGFMDAHADTISRAFVLEPNNRSLYDNDALHIDFRRLSEFEAPMQFFALWTADRFVADVFNHTNQMIDFFKEQVEAHNDIIEIARDLDDILRIARSGRVSAILTIEGGEALMGDIENLYHFYNRGVRSIGILWNRENELGFGWPQGRTQGLKPFGFEVIKKMEELGIILDVSHLNEAGFWDAHNASARPYIASHSNAYAITPHGRNLTDDQIMAIVESGGIIGFNMFPSFVSTNNFATMDDIMAHFRHFIELGAGENIALGADFDGITSTPQGITDVLSLKDVNQQLIAEFGESVALDIMERNFLNFLKRYFAT